MSVFCYISLILWVISLLLQLCYDSMEKKDFSCLEIQSNRLMDLRNMGLAPFINISQGNEKSTSLMLCHPKHVLARFWYMLFGSILWLCEGCTKHIWPFFFFFWEYKSHAVVSSGGEVNADSNLHAWIFSPPIIISWQSVLQWRCVVISSHIFMFVKWQKN